MPGLRVVLPDVPVTGLQDSGQQPLTHPVGTESPDSSEGPGLTGTSEPVARDRRVTSLLGAGLLPVLPGRGCVPVLRPGVRPALRRGRAGRRDWRPRGLRDQDQEPGTCGGGRGRGGEENEKEETEEVNRRERKVGR